VLSSATVLHVPFLPPPSPPPGPPRPRPIPRLTPPSVVVVHTFWTGLAGLALLAPLAGLHVLACLATSLVAYSEAHLWHLQTRSSLDHACPSWRFIASLESPLHTGSRRPHGHPRQHPRTPRRRVTAPVPSISFLDNTAYRLVTRCSPFHPIAYHPLASWTWTTFSSLLCLAAVCSVPAFFLFLLPIHRCPCHFVFCLACWIAAPQSSHVFLAIEVRL